MYNINNTTNRVKQRGKSNFKIKSQLIKLVHSERDQQTSHKQGLFNPNFKTGSDYIWMFGHLQPLASNFHPDLQLILADRWECLFL